MLFLFLFILNVIGLIKMELKTLKDIEEIECGCDRCDQCCGLDKNIKASDLKQEAIKRCKFIREVFFDGVDMDKSPAKTQREAYFHQLGKFEELKRFCNITEEDLMISSMENTPAPKFEEDGTKHITTT